MLVNTSSMAIRYALFTALLFLVVPARAQQVVPCTSYGSATPALIAQALAHASERGGGEEVSTIKVKVVVGAAPTEEGEPLLAVPLTRVQRDLDFTNEVFSRSNTGLQVQLCGPISVVTDFALYYMSSISPAAIAPHRVPGYITIFYSTSLAAGIGGTWLGDQVFIAAGGPANTLAHEIGHMLGLNHTHDGVIEPELVDGSNCTIGGDMLCDTPADPNLATPGYVIQPCQYVGTVTDANGDLYTPLLNNVMSYSPCVADSLTPQQGAVMRYMLHNVLLHLRRTTHPITIEPFAVLQCEHADPITLSATPAPGTFGGVYVQGDTLVNFPNPPGETYVNYVPATPPEPATAFIDQYLVRNIPQPNAHIAVSTDSVWQSFQARIDAAITHVEFMAHASAPLTVRMRLYAGVGPQGAVLHDTIATVGTDTNWVAFHLPAGLMGVEYTSYTALLTAVSPFDVFQPAGNDYAPGSSNLPMGDLQFREWVHAVPPCQETSRYYALYQVPARPVLNLPTAYCHADELPALLIADTLHLTNSTLLLDGSPAAPFMPAQLAPGAHSVQHIYTLNGCTDTLHQTLTIADVPDFNFPGLDQPWCTEDDALTLVADPPGGTFFVNDEPAALFAPGELGAGTHTVDYHYTAQLDTLTFFDQFCCYTGQPGYTALEPDSLTWQSFTAAQTGALENILLGLNLNAPERTFQLSIHSGTGTSGPLLWSDTRTVTEGYNSFFNNTGLAVQAGNTYTFALRCVEDGSPFPVDLFVFRGDGFPTGVSHVPGATVATDHYFRERIVQQFACTDSTSVAVNVQVCTGIAENAGSIVRLAPNPFTDQVIVDAGSGSLRYALYTADGRLMREGQHVQGGRFVLSGNGLAAGPYHLRVWPGSDDRSEVLRLVKVE